MMWGGLGGMGWGWIGLGLIHMVLFWVVVILGIAALVRWLSSGLPRGDSSAMEVLKGRYAKGEITREQFEEMKKVLGGTN